MVTDFRNNKQRFSVVNSACPMKKDYNTVVPIRIAMFCHLNKPIIVQFLRVFAMSQRLPWQRYSATKRPFETQFFKNNQLGDLVFFFSIFENPIKFSSLTRDMRKNYLEELDLFIKEL